jgi:hypothetical protein
MSGLVAVRQIIKTLSEEEKKVCIHFIGAFDSRGHKSPQKMSKLFGLLYGDSMDEYSEKDLEFLIYGKQNKDAFSRLLLRLRDKVVETLTLAINIERTGAYSERGKVMHESRRLLSVAQILHSRGLIDMADYYFSNVISQCSVYELYDELIMALRLRRNIRVTANGAKELYIYKKEVDHFSECREALMVAEMYFNELMAEIQFKATPETYLEQIKERIFHLKGLNRNIKSANVTFYTNYLEIHYLEFIGVYSKAATLLNVQAKLIDTSPAVKNPTRVALAKLRIAEVQIMQHRFALAKKTCEKSFVASREEGFNYLQSQIQYFYCLFYLRDIEQCKKVLTHIYSSKQINRFQKGKVDYLHACLMFSIGEFDEVYKILGQILPIESDENGWNLAVRILLTMTDIETYSIASADNRILNTGRRIQAMKKEHVEISVRYELIVDLLQDLEKASYNFKAINAGNESLLKLTSNDLEYKWKPLTPELIVFHDWFNNKRYRIGDSFAPHYPNYTEKVLRISHKSKIP